MTIEFQALRGPCVAKNAKAIGANNEISYYWESQAEYESDTKVFRQILGFKRVFDKEILEVKNKFEVLGMSFFIMKGDKKWTFVLRQSFNKVLTTITLLSTESKMVVQ